MRARTRSTHTPGLCSSMHERSTSLPLSSSFREGYYKHPFFCISSNRTHALVLLRSMKAATPFRLNTMNYDQVIKSTASPSRTNPSRMRDVNLWIQILLGGLAATLLVLFIFYATRLDYATTCRLTYDKTGAITETEMHTWMQHESWPLAVPKYHTEKRTCTCSDADASPANLTMEDLVLVWLAPGDLVSLQVKLSSALPADFIKKYQGRYAEADHVKVCLPQQYLVDLWGNGDGVKQHCHMAASATPGVVESIFIGWDGALFCAGSTESDSAGPSSPPPPLPPPPLAPPASPPSPPNSPTPSPAPSQ